MFFCLTERATTSIYPLSLHDALPISPLLRVARGSRNETQDPVRAWDSSFLLEEFIQMLVAGVHFSLPDRLDDGFRQIDRKSTRLNSSHPSISYAVFCFNKKNINYSQQ